MLYCCTVLVIDFLIAGNSKTRLAMAAAHEHGLPVISLSAADVYSAFVGNNAMIKTLFSPSSINTMSPKIGGAEAEIRRAFRIARQSQPCMLFMDELDTLIINRYGV